MQVIITSLVVFVILSRFYGAALSIKLHRKRLVLDHFSDIEDPRESWNQFYSVQELLFLTVSAVIAGADGWRATERFGENKIDFLRKFFPYSKGVPSDDTIVLVHQFLQQKMDLFSPSAE